MLIPLTRFAHVGKYVFTNKAVTKEQIHTNGVRTRTVLGYDSDLWMVPGGDIWDESQMKQFAMDNNLFIEYKGPR